MQRSRLTLNLVTCALAPLGLSSCFTGLRPSLDTTQTLAAVTDPSAGVIVDILQSIPSSSFTISYEIVTKFGSKTTTASVAYDADLGTSISIADVRYLYLEDGTSYTCSLTAETCESGIDETRVSDSQLSSRFFKGAPIERIKQDARVALRSGVITSETFSDNESRCVTFPIIDGNGAEQSKKYCVFDDFSVIAMMETGDFSVRTTNVSSTVDPDIFQTLGD